MKNNVSEEGKQGKQISTGACVCGHAGLKTSEFSFNVKGWICFLAELSEIG